MRLTHAFHTAALTIMLTTASGACLAANDDGRPAVLIDGMVVLDTTEANSSDGNRLAAVQDAVRIPEGTAVFDDRSFVADLFRMTNGAPFERWEPR